MLATSKKCSLKNDFEKGFWIDSGSIPVVRKWELLEYGVKFFSPCDFFFLPGRSSGGAARKFL
jgi:hypothetical protein